MPKALSVEDTVLGEAVAGDYADILGVVSVIDNRSRQLGVSYQDVVAAKGQFDAYGKALPPGVGKYRGLVEKAIAEVQTKGPVHAATFYATPAAAKGLPKGLAFETKTAGHNYYSDPKGRAIGTAQGYKTPDPAAMAETRNVAGDPPETLYDVVEANPQAAPQAAPSFAALPEVGPTPMGRPSDQAGQARGLAAPSPFGAVLGGALGATTPTGNPYSLSYKAESKRSGVANMTPEAQAAMANFSRGLKDPLSFTVTSTTEPRSGAKKSHIDDRAAFDMRTRDQTRKGLDEAVVAAMYTPSVKSIGLDFNPLAPHMHVGTTTPYGRGVLSGTAYSKLSPDIASSLRSWDAYQKGITDEFSPPVPESIAPTPTSRPSQGFVSIAGDIGMPSIGPAFSPAQSATATGGMGVDPSVAGPIGPSYNIDQAGLTAPGFTGPAPRSVSTQAIGPTGVASVASPSQTSYGPAGATPAGFTELGAIGKTGRAGVSAPSFAPASILGEIAMPTVGPTFAPAAPAFTAPMSVPTPTANPMRSAQIGMPAPVAAPVAQVSIPGPLGPQARTQTAAPAIGPMRGQEQRGFGSMARGAAGGFAGAMVGGALMGPLGGMLGGYLGRQMAQGKLGRSQSSRAQAAFARGFTPGLSFPTAPIGPSSQGGLTAFGEAASRGEYGGQAQAAANNPGKGLY